MFTEFSTDHEAPIHDIQYNYFENQIATCSSDHKIKIWKQINDSWKKISEWDAEQSAVTKIVWACPQYGDLIASLGLDGTVKIWSNTMENKWILKKVFTRFKSSINDIKFSPPHFSLCLVFDCLKIVYLLR